MKVLALLGLIVFQIFQNSKQATISSPPQMKVSYTKSRDAIIDAEEKLFLGGKIILTNKEKQVDELLRKFKENEIQNGMLNPREYAPSLHFFRAKKIIEMSQVFKIIRKMPKGAVLHAHNTAMVSSEWFLKNVTYLPGALKCHNTKNITTFSFLSNDEERCINPVLVKDERANSTDPNEYDEQLEKFLNLYTNNPEGTYPDSTTVWNEFQRIFDTVGSTLAAEHVYKMFHRQLLQELYDDNIIYTEIRTSFSKIVNKNGIQLSAVETARVMNEVFQDFKKQHTDFLGARAIYSTSRSANKLDINARTAIYKELVTELPDFVIGFDLVGQEDLGKPLINFVDDLKQISRQAKFFFHAGETNWFGTSVDWNILDAILLNTTRIGHGYALIKHPILWETIKRRDIAIEINPISNQVLHFVSDLRNHPAAFYFAEDLPVIISNDDPGFWNAKGLSYDMYYAFMCFAHANAGLGVLKALVWNSLKYATLTDDERIKGARLLASKWNVFLDEIIAGDF